MQLLKFFNIFCGCGKLGSLTRIPEHDVLITDFDEVVTCDFPRVGSATTPAHNTPDFTFTSIAPKAFRYFRNYYKIDILDFMVSLCDKPLKELSNPGASGSLFYVTDDDQYIVKTLENKEAVFLRKLLPGYFLNMTQSQATLLPKFFGLFIYGTNLGRNIRLIIMNNLLPREIPLHEKFDLKGSLSGRFASKKELSKASPTLKDLDFLKVHSSGIALSKETFLLVKTTISSDCRVLRSFKIMDYSLLVGIHQISKETFTQLSHVGSGSEPETLS
jgi:1-phosphatidylinositol-4-phosphate 5-kinase